MPQYMMFTEHAIEYCFTQKDDENIYQLPIQEAD